MRASHVTCESSPGLIRINSRVLRESQSAERLYVVIIYYDVGDEKLIFRFFIFERKQTPSAQDRGGGGGRGRCQSFVLIAHYETVMHCVGTYAAVQCI